MSPDSSYSLAEQVGELRSRVQRLEQALLQHGILLQPAEAVPAVPSVSQPAAAYKPEMQASQAFTQIQEQPPSPNPAFPTLDLSASTDEISLESRIGSQWFNRVGILAMLFGMAWFLKLAIDNHWIGPLGRVSIGLAAGAGLIAWSERFRGRGYAVFSYSLKAVGSGTLYLSLWASFQLFHLIPPGVAFSAMIMVTTFNGLMAWMQDAELLALYAIVGGVSTPLLLSTGGNHEISLFSYLLLLNIAVFVLVALRPWSRLLFGAFLGTVSFYVGWWLSYYSTAQSLRTAFFLACFFLLFALAPHFANVPVNDDTQVSGWDTLALVLLPIANAVFGFTAFYVLLDQPGVDWAEPWLAVSFAAFYLTLIGLPARDKLPRGPGVHLSLHLTLAVIFLTIAIPLKTHGRWLTIGWLSEGAALLWLASRQKSFLLRTLALLCLAIGLFALIAVNPPASATPLFNTRFAAYCAAIAIFSFNAWTAAKTQADVKPALSWPALAAASILIVNVLILLSIGLEIHNFWWRSLWRGDQIWYGHYRMYAQFSYSAWFMLFGAALLSTGFWRRSAFLRWQALLLLAVSIGKVFLLDVSALSQGYRIVSFLGLGALLLGVSFAYQRDWLNLRGRGDRADDTTVQNRWLS